MLRTVVFIILTFIACIIAGSDSFARIGETFEQCNKRYGDPVSQDSTIVRYKKNGMHVIVSFFEGRASMIVFRKQKEGVLGIPDDLSDNEKEILLNANGGGKKWEERQVISMSDEWQTVDSKIFATYNIMEKMLMVATKDHLDRVASKKEASEKEKLTDF